MSKHTPKPWQIDQGGQVHKDGRTIFSWPQLSGAAEEEIHANMRLGHAAPDLLDALRAIVMHPSYAESEDGETGEPCELIAAGRAAIAKAEGKDDAAC